MKFLNPLWLNALFLIIPLAMIFFAFYQYRKRAINKFIDPDLLLDDRHDMLITAWIKASLFIVVFVLIVLSLARPQWGYEWREVKRQGLDILIAVDTSKSMLTTDVRPNRLERVKFAVQDIVKKVKGDRLGLIAFSGDSFLMCPLTVDYSGFLLSLTDLNVDLLPRGGTNIAKAIEEGLRGYKNTPSQYKAIIIITDGESLEGDVLKAAKKAKDNGVKIYTVGVGSKEGELIRVQGQNGEEFLKDNKGNVVKSRLNESLLTDIASITGGVYVHASGAQFGLDYIYDRYLSKLEKRDIQETMEKHYYERFQIPLFLAVCFLFGEVFIVRRKKS